MKTILFISVFLAIFALPKAIQLWKNDEKLTIPNALVFTGGLLGGIVIILISILNVMIMLGSIRF